MKRLSLFYWIIIGLFLIIANTFAQDKFPEELTADALKGTPTIDAEIEDCWGEGYAFQGDNGGITDGDFDISFTWYALWDEEGMYVVIDVKDNFPDWAQDDLNDSGDAFNENPWLYDNIEIYVNPTGQRNPEDGSYEPANASQIRYNPTDGTLDVNNSGIGYAAEHFDEVVWVSVEVSGGYILETLIPWTAILSDPTILPDKIGFTINVLDSDGGSRRPKIVVLWVGAGYADEQWHNINYFGLLYLSDSTSSCYNSTDIKEDKEEIEYKIFPNPAHDYISINSPVIDELNIEIYDMLGRKILSKQCTNNEKINISLLIKGHYLIKVFNNNSIITKSLIIK